MKIQDCMNRITMKERKEEWDGWTNEYRKEIMPFF
jgi:hypothetical protein